MSSQLSLWQKFRFLWRFYLDELLSMLAYAIAIMMVFGLLVDALVRNRPALQPAVTPLVFGCVAVISVVVVIFLVHRLVEKWGIMMLEVKVYLDMDWGKELVYLRSYRDSCQERREDVLKSQAALKAERERRLRKLDKSLKYLHHDLVRNTKNINEAERKIKIGEFLTTER